MPLISNLKQVAKKVVNVSALQTGSKPRISSVSSPAINKPVFNSSLFTAHRYEPISSSIRALSTLESKKPLENAKKAAINPRLLGIGLLATALAAYLAKKMIADKQKNHPQEDELIQLVLTTIKEQFPHLLPKNFSHETWWQQLERDGYIEQHGEDKTWRPVFVSLQAATESALLYLHQNGKLNFTAHCTHTDLPSSPLCEIKEKDMHPDIAADPARKETVSSRVTIMANILKTNIPIYVVYSKDGLSQRSPEAQERYRHNVKTYSNLFDRPLAKKLADEDSGATLSFRSKTSASPAFFSISSLQATTEGSQWRIGLDSTSHPKSDKTKQLLEKRKIFFEENGLNEVSLSLKK